MNNDNILTQIYRLRLDYLEQGDTISQLILTRKAFRELKKEVASMARFPNRPEELKHILPGDTHRTIMLRNYKRWARGMVYGIPVRPAFFSERQEHPIVVTIEVEQ